METPTNPNKRKDISPLASQPEQKKMPTNSEESPDSAAAVYQPVAITNSVDYKQWAHEALKDPPLQALVQALLEEPQKAIASNTRRLDSLEDIVQQQSLKLDEQAIKLDELEQYSRRESLRFYNPDWKEPGVDASGKRQKEDTNQLIYDFITTKLSYTGFKKGFIARSHRAGKASAGAPRGILCKFITYDVRASVYKLHGNLPENCTMNEDLTPATAKLAYFSRQLKLKNHIANTWVRDGRVWVQGGTGARGKIVRTTVELLEQVVPPCLDPKFTWKEATTQDKEMTPMKYIDMVRSRAPVQPSSSQASTAPKTPSNGKPRGSLSKTVKTGPNQPLISAHLSQGGAG